MYTCIHTHKCIYNEKRNAQVFIYSVSVYHVPHSSMDVDGDMYGSQSITSWEEEEILWMCD